VKKLPKKFQGAAVVRGLGMNSSKCDDLVMKKSVGQFDATQNLFLVLADDVLEDDYATTVRGFTDEAAAVRYARALANGNVNHRVLRVTEQTLVVATDNEL
jgi:hypothetical protein